MTRLPARTLRPACVLPAPRVGANLLMCAVVVCAAAPWIARAQASPPAPSGSTAGEAASSAAAAAETAGLQAWAPRLRAEYLSGEAILVPFQAHNPGATELQVPDLAARPWLVTFALQADGGQVQRRSTTAPAVDPGGAVRLAPRGGRLALLEVPGTAALKPGRYRLVVTVQGPAGPIELGRQDLTVAAPRPVSGSLPDASAARAVLSTVWLHAAAQGFDLYLHEAQARSPLRPLSHAHLAHLDQRVEPLLSATRGSDANNRHVVWMEGPRRLVALQVRGRDAPDAPRALTLPWPRAELMGRPATDGVGRLHVPLWVPAPSGAGGELRVLSLGARAEPHFRRVAALDAPPAVQVMVTDDGAVQLLVQMLSGVDLFTIGAEEVSPDLPVSGRKIWRPVASERALAARFAPRAAAEGVRAGLGLCVLAATETAVQPRWFSLRGATLPAGDVLPRPAGAALAELLPAPDGGVAAIWRTQAGLSLQWGPTMQPVPADLGRAWTLGWGEDGALLARGLSDGGPLRLTPLAAPASPR